MKTILFIHQSAELYGSDKTYLLLIKNLDKSKFLPLVIIPSEGPLKIEFEKAGIRVIVTPVLKLHRKMFSFRNLFYFIKDIKKSISMVSKLHKTYHIDLIYSNTLAVLLGFFSSKKLNIKHLWHIHEIIVSPKFVIKLYRLFLKNESTKMIVCNSQATQKYWCQNATLSQKSTVIWNGLEFPKKTSDFEIQKIRLDLFKTRPNDVVIAIIGRISKLKGQQVLLDAFNNLIRNHSNLKLVIVGTPPPNKEYYLTYLLQQIERLKLNKYTTVLSYQNDINKVWDSIDIAVVPSIEPESFGLVALEAMLAKKPVIGSNHGGLTEIILNHQTGLLVEPNNVLALENALGILIKNEEMRISFGKLGYQRAIDNFSLRQHVSQFEKLLENL